MATKRGGTEWTAGRLLRRRWSTRPAASVLVGVLALVTVLVAAIVPRMVERQTTAELAYQLQSAGAVGRSLQGVADFPENWDSEPPPSAGQLYGDLQSAFVEARAGLPQPLRGIVGQPSWIVQAPTVPSVQVDGAVREVGLRLTSDQDYLSRIRIVAGTAPATWSTSDTNPADETASVPVDVLLSVRSAGELHLSVGDLVGTDAVAGTPQRLYRVSGLFEPRNAHAAYWSENPSLLPATPEVPTRGPTYLSAAAFVDPLTVGRLSQTFGNARISLYYPVSSTGVDGSDSRLLDDQLAAVITTGVRLPGTDRTMQISTRAQQAVQAAGDRGALLAGLIALLAAAPIGVMLAVLVLGVQVVVRGRRSDLVLASARGASGLQVRGAMAFEGALLSVPAAIVVIVLTSILVPARPEVAAFVLPALAALVPPVLFAALAVTSEQPGPVRRAAGSLRGIAEVAVMLLAVLALVLLARRGLVQASAAVGVDPLLSAVPLLLSVSVGIIVMRGYPLPMRAISRVAARRRSLPGFVGAIRATRAPTVGLAGVLALVVGISVSLFSAVLFTTFDSGIHAAAAQSVGADARVEGSGLTTAERSAIARVPGVRDVAGLQYLSSEQVTKTTVNATVTMILSDTAPLATLRSLPAAMATEVDGRIPVVVSADLRRALGARRDLVVGGVPAVVVGALPANSQLGPTGRWIVADATFAPRFDVTFSPQTLLLRADPARLAQLAAPLRAAAGVGSTVTTAPGALAAREAEPVVLGVQVALLLGAALAVVLCALALVLSTAAAGASRGRTAGILRTLGMRRRSLRVLIAWELLPVAIAALVVGAALGIALPFVLTAAVDLSAFTGGVARLTPVLQPVILAAVLAVFAAVVAVSGIVAVRVGDSVNPSSTLKMGES